MDEGKEKVQAGEANLQQGGVLEVEKKPESRALVPTSKEAIKALVVEAVRSALAGQRESIGVSLNWLAKHVEELHLKPEEVETLVRVKTEFGGLLPHAVKFLYKGLTAQEVCGCYQARQVLADMEDGASIVKIAKLALTFSEADPENPGLGEMIAEAHQVISTRYFWVKYVDQSISILCAIAQHYGCVTIDAALAMVDSRHSRKNGVAAEGGMDEVERHRDAYEKDRRYY